jgi:molybdopterin converting factor small subunit
MSSASVLNFAEIDSGIQEELRRAPPMREPQPADYAPPAYRSPPMPEYVTHREGVSDVGRLSAEALVREYEGAASSLDRLGLEVKALLDDLSARYREEGKRVFREVEDCAMITEEVQKLCAALRGKIAVTKSLE